LLLETKTTSFAEELRAAERAGTDRILRAYGYDPARLRMYAGYQRHAAAVRQPRYVKRRYPGTFRGRPVGPRPAQRAAAAARAKNRQIANARTGGLLGVEVKFLDAPKTATALTAPTDATTGMHDPSSIVTGCLSAPAQGDGPTNRDGARIAIKSIYVNGMLTVAAQADQTGADHAGVVFIALVLDKQTNAAQMTSELCFTNQNAAAASASCPQRNMSYTKRFDVLKTKTIRLPMPTIAFDGTNIEQSGYHLPWKLKKRFPEGLKVQFAASSTTADVANVIDNSLHIIAYTTNTSLAPNILYNSRMRFVG